MYIIYVITHCIIHTVYCIYHTYYLCFRYHCTLYMLYVSLHTTYITHTHQTKALTTSSFVRLIYCSVCFKFLKNYSEKLVKQF